MTRLGEPSRSLSAWNTRPNGNVSVRRFSKWSRVLVGLNSASSSDPYTTTRFKDCLRFSRKASGLRRGSSTPKADVAGVALACSGGGGEGAGGGEQSGREDTHSLVLCMRSAGDGRRWWREGERGGSRGGEGSGERLPSEDFWAMASSDTLFSARCLRCTDSDVMSADSHGRELERPRRRLGAGKNGCFSSLNARRRKS
jgi:hypothetical protein